MVAFILWYLLISLVGWCTFPLVYRFLEKLPGRGFGFSRPLGLLLWSFIFWLLASLRIVDNTSGGMAFAGGLVLVLSLVSLKNGQFLSLRQWLKDNRRFVITSEVLFLAAFALWALVRAVSPEVSGTEKPMELAFINAILKSPTFPPNDPWLSGYSISYYYFGYVMVAMLTRLTGVLTGVAFNLASALWFAMTALAAYTLVYALLGEWSKRKGETASQPVFSSLLAPTFVLIVSNIEGFLEMLHARGLFWTQAADGSWQSSFWQWLGIQEINQAPTTAFTWMPQRPTGIWWWRASRVLQDFDLSGNGKEVIDEFPFFSYYLADLHPHVLAMPFVLLVIGLAFNIYLKLREEPFAENGVNLAVFVKEWTREESVTWRDLRIVGWLRRPDFWLVSAVMGGLAFLNTWDFPIYVGLFSAAVTLSNYERDGWRSARIWEFIELGLITGVAGILLYLPFYVGFSSQAGGLLPSLAFFTRGANLWVMFAPLLLPIFAWLIWNAAKEDGRERLGMGLKISLGLVGGLWLVSYLLVGLFLGLYNWGTGLLLSSQSQPAFLTQLAAKTMELGGLFNGLHGASDASTLIFGSLARRFAQPGAWLTLLGLLALVWGLLIGVRSSSEGKKTADEGRDSASPFVLLMVLVGAGLVLFPEFFYLRDQFGGRMNTIFKFYFQAWILWALVAAFASVVMVNSLKRSGKIIFSVGWVVLILMGLAYPYWGIYQRFKGVSLSSLSLDGLAQFGHYAPEELNAAYWLKDAPLGVVAEAVGGQYTGYARISTYSGQPAVLGWPGHESQWRGGATEMGNREQDMELLYRTADWNQALEILQRYQIRYVFIGSLERSTYRANETKFQTHLKPVFQEGNVVIYEYAEITPAVPRGE